MTDNEGDVECPFNPIIAPVDGAELKITAHVSGIRELSVMHVVQRRVKTPAEIARDAANNKRARKFNRIAAYSWVVCLLIALIFPGKPLIDREQTSLLPHPQTLSREQLAFNDQFKGTSWEIKLKPTPPARPWWQDSWQKPLFSLVLLWSGFSLVYGALSLREEVMDAIRRGAEKLIDRHYFSARARDPLFQRLLAFSGHLKTVRRQEAPEAVAAATTVPTGAPGAPAATTTPAAGHSIPFWHLFRSDLLSDFVTNILPEIIRAIFKR